MPIENTTESVPVCYIK